jgi:3-oxoacyl-[acyl-carrier protein] reductase
MIVTGASRGLGRALSENYAERGFQVVGCSRGESDFTHSRYRHVCLDVADEGAVVKLVRGVASDFGRLDALINNAGTASMNHALLTPMSSVESILRTNVQGVFLFCREAAKAMMKARRGRIVNLATVATPLRLEGESVYAASKAAVCSLTEILAREFGEFGVTVNAVGPTPIDTDLIRGVPQEKIDQLIARQALKRMCELRDVANAIDFFLRPDSDFVTGQVLYLGGVPGC